MIVCEIRQWQGSYWSRDIPGGVEISPYTTQVSIINEKSRNFNHHELSLPQELGSAVGYPKLSPNGHWIYFQARNKNKRDIYRIRLDGTGLYNLTQDSFPFGDCFGYKLSRDASKILFIYNDSKTCRVGIINSDGTNPFIVAPELGYHYMADISVDNSKLIFCNVDEGYTLYIKDLVSSFTRRVVDNLQDCLMPTFLPCDKKIIFMRRGGDLYSVDIDGKNLLQLTYGNNYDAFYLSPYDRHGSTDSFAISTDGKKIAYIVQINNLPQLYLMNSDGSNQYRVLEWPSPCGRPLFSPDNNRIGFVSWQGDSIQLYSVDIKTSKVEKYTSIEGAVYNYDWNSH
jgi:Tol biopolymer transport system component